ncbi:MAG: hypothetical protein FJ387_09685 [Verrucomicrobia bacterium]|nr:hypothetical protein [Verrucomicrobiota bacterium]
MKATVRTFTTPSLIGAALALAASAAQAKDYLLIYGQTTDAGPALNFQQGGQSMPDLVENLIRGTDQFSNLQNRGFFARLDYGDVAQALRFDVQQEPAGWRALLSSPFQPGLIQRQFFAPTRDELEQQVEDYLQRDGSTDLGAFLKAVNGQSAFATMNGNPNSTTALTATYAFNEYGLPRTLTAEEKADPSDPSGAVGFALMGDAGFVRSRGFDVRTYSLTPFLPIRLCSRARLDLGLPLNYTDIEGSQTFRAGLQLGLPALLAKRRYEAGRPVQPWLWQLTPHGGTQVAGSVDLVAGGVVNSGGLTSLLAYDFGRLEVSWGSHFSFHESLEVTFGDYTFDAQVSSQIIKNGLKIGVPLGKRWYVEIYALDTELLGDHAFMSRYTTLGGGFGHRFLGKPDSPKKKKGYTMVGAYTNIGKAWTSASVQFGTGWKF